MMNSKLSPVQPVYQGLAVVLAAAVLVWAPVLPARDLPAPVPQEAARIDSIAPTCASVGAQVSITGIGFGAQNVAISVGGVSAQVVTANGHSATFIVPAGANLGPTSVTATNPGGQTGSIAFKVCDLLVPEAWGGEWDITTTYQNATNNSVIATDNITAFIRTNEPFGLAPAANAGSCAGSVSDTHIEILCSGQATTGTCTLGTSAQISANLNVDTINGSGTTTISFTGNCGPLATSPQTILINIQISGQRLSMDQNPSGPPTTLVKSFVPFSPLIGSGQ